MVINSHDIEADQVINTDICIVGAGVAGLTLASELRNQKYRVSLIECGGLEPHKPTQALFWGENIGQPSCDSACNAALQVRIPLEVFP